MAKKMLIDATHAEETRVVVVDGNKVEEFDFESENKRQLAGNIYLAKVTRVEPSLQAAFVDYGGNRHGFLAFSEIHPDYYQIPVADRKALMEEEAALAAAAEEEEDKPKRASRSRSRKKSSPKPKPSEKTTEAIASQDDQREISGMETIDLSDGEETEAVAEAGAPGEGLSPMTTVNEAPIGEPVESIESDGSEAEAPASVQTSSPAAEAVPVDAEPAAPVAAPETVAEETSEPAVDAQADQPPAGEASGTDSEEGGSEESAAPQRPMAAASDDDALVVSAEPGETAEDGDASDEDDDEEDDSNDASARDESIESVADDDTHEDIRPVRKPSRARRYKIQEVIKVRQIMLVQVVKEERGNKGAALTTYLSLAGRYCVLMPNTARGGGISRKITNATDRSKLKAIANEIDVPKGAGLIIRTAGAKRTKTEIKRDYEYLQRLWEQIRELTLKSIAPAKIYEEGDLIKRSIRDLYSREIDEVLVEGERGYRVAKDFMKMIMPSHAKNVKHYVEPMPLFARFQVESYLGGMFNPTVQLKSGGYIVIGVTEALVAIDVNSGRATKEGSIEETALKTNLEAAEEVARQLRLRDLAGLIVIDFIDMDERKNNAAVEKKLKDKLKTDRARIQVGRISGFGLLEMSRQRLRPGMIEATTQPCAACHGTGLIRSDDNMALQILRQIEEEGVRRRSREVLVKCPVGIANYLMNQKREHVAMIEARYGMAVRIEGDVHLIAPDFSLEKFKTATRSVPEPASHVVSVDTSLMDLVDEEGQYDEDAEIAEEEPEVEETTDKSANEKAPAPASEDGEEKPKKKRRRRRRRSSKSKDGENGDDQSDNGDSSDEESGSDESASETDGAEAGSDEGEAKKKPSRTRSRSRSRSRSKASDTQEPETTQPTGEAPATDVTEEAPAEVAAAPVAEAVADMAQSEAPVETPVAETAPEGPAESTPAPVEAEAPVAAEEAPAQSAPAAELGENGEGEIAEKARPARTRVKASDYVAQMAPSEEATAEAEPQPETPAEPIAEAAPAEAQPTETAHAESQSAEAQSAEAAPSEAQAQSAEEEPKTKRRGWWSLGR
ncbi:Rne/Rng family ribonuclease [Sagittula salina]|uniref:Ribonuclease E n=1 Tax=Sagittula salina TaxID=2820268 RepID=A0A940MKD8_9RHOB|nr:ribonuclease E/G [Sagittula salina]MBP0480969.1 Rne/Rng family ribonuclease [Sagittula salina]